MHLFVVNNAEIVRRRNERIGKILSLTKVFKAFWLKVNHVNRPDNVLSQDIYHYPKDDVGDYCFYCNPYDDVRDDGYSRSHLQSFSNNKNSIRSEFLLKQFSYASLNLSSSSFLCHILLSKNSLSNIFIHFFSLELWKRKYCHVSNFIQNFLLGNIIFIIMQHAWNNYNLLTCHKKLN